MRTLADRTLCADAEHAVDADALHQRKNDLLRLRMAEQGLNLRLGVSNVARSPKEDELKLGLVAAISRGSIETVLAGLGGRLRSAYCDFAGDVMMVQSGKSNPDVYLAALDHLGVGADACVAIEYTGSAGRRLWRRGFRRWGSPVTTRTGPNSTARRALWMAWSIERFCWWRKSDCC